MAKIKQITIEGMHNVLRKTYNFKDLTYLFGTNGAGKSTVMQAIQLALLGYIPGTNKTKTEIFRHANGHSMAVSLTIDCEGSEVKIQRVWSGTKSNVVSTVEIIPEGYNVEKLIEDLELPIFNFNEFIDMTANKLKDWFIEFLPSSETHIDWNIALREDLIVAGLANIDEDLVKSCAKDISGFNLKGTDEIRKANEYFKSTLSFKKKELERLQSTIQSLIFYDDIDSDVDESEVRTAIAEYQKKNRERDLRADAVRRYKFMKQQLDEYSDCTAVSAEEDTRYVESKGVVDGIAAKTESINTEIGKVTVARSELNTKLGAIRESIAALKAKNDLMKGIIDSKGICPFTSQGCTSIKEMIAEYKKEVESNNNQIEKYKSDGMKLKTKIEATQTRFDSLNQDLRNIRLEESEANRTMQYVVFRYEKYNQLKASIGEPPVAEFEDTDYDSLIREAQDLLVKIEANKRYNELVDTLTSDKFKLEQEIIAYNSWIKLTGVNGLQNDDSATKPFLDLANHMNKYIQTVFGEDVTAKFNLEAKANSFSFGVERNGTYIPFNLLSSGEKCLYTLSMMISLVASSNSPLKIVMIDDLLDHLDDINVTKLFESLQKVKDIQMIFAGVKNVNGDFVVEVK